MVMFRTVFKKKRSSMGIDINSLNASTSNRWTNNFLEIIDYVSHVCCLDKLHRFSKYSLEDFLQGSYIRLHSFVSGYAVNLQYQCSLTDFNLSHARTQSWIAEGNINQAAQSH